MNLSPSDWRSKKADEIRQASFRHRKLRTTQHELVAKLEQDVSQ
jgi:hypothetical protein